VHASSYSLEKRWKTKPYPPQCPVMLRQAFLVGSSAALVAGPLRGGAATESWSERARLPMPRSEVGVAAVDGYVFVVGGFAPDGDQRALLAYNVRSDGWQRRSSLPRGLNHPAVAALGGRVFVFGGFAQEDGRPLSDAYAYDPAADKWSSLASLPSPRRAAAAATFEQGLHVVGGNSGGSLGLHERYDPKKNVWETRAPLPVGRDHLAAVSAHGTLFAIAGRIGSFRHNVRRTDAYDFARDAWISKAPLPTARSGVTGALYRDRIVVCGGESPRGAFATVEAYDPQADAGVSSLRCPRRATERARLSSTTSCSSPAALRVPAEVSPTYFSHSRESISSIGQFGSSTADGLSRLPAVRN